VDTRRGNAGAANDDRPCDEFQRPRSGGILVSLDDGQGNVRYVITNPSGYYRFVNVSTFQQYTVKVTSKKYTFPTPERVVEFDEFTTPVNFVSSDN
jgi:hypothetical protein